MSVLTLKWEKVREVIAEQFGKKPDLQTALFLVGLDDLGKVQKEFTKEEKQDLIHLGVCKVLTYSGYYEYIGLDNDGWPHYKAMKQVPKMTLTEQEELLRAHIIHHFEEMGLV